MLTKNERSKYLTILTYQETIMLLLCSYSLRIGKGSRLGQRHGLQNTTLTSYILKNIYRKVIYVNFYESIFQDKSIHITQQETI